MGRALKDWNLIVCAQNGIAQLLCLRLDICKCNLPSKIIYKNREMCKYQGCFRNRIKENISKSVGKSVGLADQSMKVKLASLALQLWSVYLMCFKWRLLTSCRADWQRLRHKSVIFWSFEVSTGFNWIRSNTHL